MSTDHIGDLAPFSISCKALKSVIKIMTDTFSIKRKTFCLNLRKTRS